VRFKALCRCIRMRTLCFFLVFDTSSNVSRKKKRMIDSSVFPGVGLAMSGATQTSVNYSSELEEASNGDQKAGFHP